jgi:hypothetical protein
MREIALHLLDIAENSVAARARNVTISVYEDLYNDRLGAAVEDDGKGMDAEMLARVADPFVTTRTTRKVGLGIPLFKAAAEACHGGLQIHSVAGQGTRLEVQFQRSHIDRMPLGDLPGTILSLVIAYPDIHWVFTYTLRPAGEEDEKAFVFDDRPIKNELDGLPLTEPGVLSFLREYLEEGVAEIQSSAAEAAATFLTFTETSRLNEAQ